MDRYGNLTGQTATAGSTPSNMPPVNSATNQISTLLYDASGNILNDGNNALVYDAENRIVSSTKAGATSTYGYDCKSLRVQKVAGGVTTVYIYSGGKVIAEYENGALPTAPAREYIYSGSTMLAKIEAGNTRYYHPDHLSNRVLTDSNGAVLGQQGQFPFGQSWYDTNATKFKFATYERDPESGNDYAMARSYASSLGRFTGPDPVAGALGNPQTLNRYNYVANDPINYADPSGRFLTALTLFLDRAGFPNAMQNLNEMWLMWGDFSYIEGSPSFTGGFLLVGPVGDTHRIKLWDKTHLIQLLRAKNPCSKWLDNGKPGSAADELNNVKLLDETVEGGAHGLFSPPDATTPDYPGAIIHVNTLGRFYSDAQNGLPVGDVYPAGSNGARAVIMLHELAHHLHPEGIVPDALSPADSDKNTQTVMKNCKDTIDKDSTKK